MSVAFNGLGAAASSPAAEGVVLWVRDADAKGCKEA